MVLIAREGGAHVRRPR